MLLGFFCLHFSQLQAQTVLTPGDDIQAAINAATPGDVIELSNGTYTISGTIRVNKSLTIQGESEAGVILNASGLSPATAYVIMTDADDITLSNFTIQPNSDLMAGFTIKAGANSLPTINSNLTLENITVDGAVRTPFDIHGIDGVTLTNLTAMNTSSGNGINIAGSTDVTVSGFFGRGNAWGAIGIYASQHVGRPSINVVIDGPSLDVVPPNQGAQTLDCAVYTQDDLGTPTLINSGVVVTDWCYAVKNPDFRMDAEEFTFFVSTEEEAIQVADELDNQMMTSSSSFTFTGFGNCNNNVEPVPALGTFSKMGLMLFVMGFAVFFAYRRMA